MSDVPMSAPEESQQQSSASPEDQGVLSKLPRTRPQRSSPRRAAARTASDAAQAATVAPDRSNGRRPARARNAAASGSQRAAATRSPARNPARPPRSRSARAGAAGARASAEPVPRQGFECEGERARGTVQPPGGAELVASAAEIVGELAKAGLSTGERLLRDVLSRLPLS
jgi:hypothetical protein